MTIDGAITQYELTARSSGYSSDTVTHVKRCVRFFSEFMGNIPDVEKITASDLRRFIVALQQQTAWAGLPQAKERKLSGTSINTYVRGIKSFWNTLLKEGIIPSNPLARVPAPKLPKTIPKIYSEEQLLAVFEAAGEDTLERAIIALLLDSGIRLAEMVGLKTSDLDSKNGRMIVTGKGNKERYAYFCEDTALIVDNYLTKTRPKAAIEEALFLTAEAHPINKKQIQDLLENAGRKAGISERLAPHKLRHTNATLLLKNGMNMEYLKKVLGHEDIQTTSQAYLNVADNDVATAHRKASPIANLNIRTSGNGIDNAIDVSSAIKGVINIPPTPQTVLETRSEVTAIPAMYTLEGELNRYDIHQFFTVDVCNESILIENIQITISESALAYRLMLFEENPDRVDFNWWVEDLLQCEMTKRRTYTYAPGGGLPYHNKDGKKVLNGGIVVEPRPLALRSPSDGKGNAVYVCSFAPVTFAVTVRYRVLEQ